MADSECSNCWLPIFLGSDDPTLHQFEQDAGE